MLFLCNIPPKANKFCCEVNIFIKWPLRKHILQFTYDFLEIIHLAAEADAESELKYSVILAEGILQYSEYSGPYRFEIDTTYIQIISIN